MPAVQHQEFIITFFPRFFKAAWEEVVDADPKTQVVARLDVCTALVRQGSDAESLAKIFHKRNPTFIQHLAPVEAVAKLDGTRDDFERLEEAVLEAAPIDPCTPFVIQCRKGKGTISGTHEGASYGSRDVEIAVGIKLGQRGLYANLHEYLQVVSIYLSEGLGYVGVSLASENLTRRADEHRYRSMDSGHISRAQYKLAEALDVFGIAVSTATRALDLGAAPGGWTEVLVKQGAYVVAVDPGALDPSLERHPQVEHLRERIENLNFEPGSFNLVVNDMNVAPAESAALMCKVAPWVREGSPEVMTIKLVSARPHRLIEQASNVLAHAYKVLSVRHLHHNRQEVTCLLQREQGLVTDGWQDHVVAGRGRRAEAG